MVISIKCSAKCLAHGKHQIHGPCYCCHSYSVNECGQGPGNILIFLLIEENPVSNQSSRRYSPTRCLFYNVKLMNKRWKRQIYQCNRKFTFAHAHMVLNKQRPKKKKREREYNYNFAQERKTSQLGYGVHGRSPFSNVWRKLVKLRMDERPK